MLPADLRPVLAALDPALPPAIAAALVHGIRSHIHGQPEVAGRLAALAADPRTADPVRLAIFEAQDSASQLGVRDERRVALVRAATEDIAPEVRSAARWRLHDLGRRFPAESPATRSPVDQLQPELASGDELARTWATFHLGIWDGPAFETLTRLVSTDASFLVRVAAADALAGALQDVRDQAEVVERLGALATGDAPFPVRLAAAQGLAREAVRFARPRPRALLASCGADVRAAVARWLRANAGTMWGGESVSEALAAAASLAPDPPGGG